MRKPTGEIGEVVNQNRMTRELNYSSVMPASKVASVTYAMLVEHLDPDEIIHRPEGPFKPFRWFISLKNKKEVSAACFEESTLLVCRENTARAMIDENPSSLFLVLVNQDKIPEWLWENGRQHRALLVRASCSFVHYERIVQHLFIENLIWENDMDYIVYSKARLDSLIAASISTLKNFVCITDTGFNLITCSKDIDPPNPVYQHLVEIGSYDKTEIASLKSVVLPHAKPRDNLIIQNISEHNPHVTVHSPIYIDNAYVFHVAMVYEGHHSLEAACDLFKKFVTRAASMCNDFWTSKIVLESPCHKMLIQLINNKKINRETIDAQFDIAKIPRDSRFRLLCYRLDPKQTYSTNSNIIKAAERLNDGWCHPFTYENNLLVLCYSPLDDEAGISLRKVHRSVANELHKQFAISAGSSQVFTDIKDISFAYKQTVTALRVRHLLKRAYPEGFSGDGSYPLYPFEYALSFILFEKGRDEELIEHAFSDSILQKLIEEDKNYHTDLVTLLWNYICTERNASDTSTRIHTHRNTVIYHIKKLESRFDIPLDVPMVRSRLILDYQYHIFNSIEL